jgi:pimeloyl-ACP methyl ester carboxylesterase
MGETISTLVFRPPPPTYIRPDRYFFIDVPVTDDDTYSCAGCGGFEPVPAEKGKERSKSPHSTMDHPAVMNLPSIPTQAYRIPATFIRRKGANVTFLYSHGNAEDLGMMYNRMKEMARILGVNIFAYDYTGYGLSRCVSENPTQSSETNVAQPSEAMCYRNIEAAYNYLRYERKIPASSIVLYGRSVGSGPSCYLARKTALEGESVGGLILHSPFLSIYSIVLDLGFPIVGDMFRNDVKAKDIRYDTMFIWMISFTVSFRAFLP